MSNKHKFLTGYFKREPCPRLSPTMNSHYNLIMWYNTKNIYILLWARRLRTQFPLQKTKRKCDIFIIFSPNLRYVPKWSQNFFKKKTKVYNLILYVHTYPRWYFCVFMIVKQYLNFMGKNWKKRFLLLRMKTKSMWVFINIKSFFRKKL